MASDGGLEGRFEMTKQGRLTDRVRKKARALVGADGVHRLGNGNLSFRTVSLSKPGTFHDVYLKWGANGDGERVLHANCVWVEPVSGSQVPCSGNSTKTVCWHVLASVIEALEKKDNGKRIAFFSYKRGTEIHGRNVWFVVSNKGGVKKKRGSVAKDMADLGFDRDTALPIQPAIKDGSKMWK